MFQITKRAGAAPQQHCELQNEHELHHSNVAKHKTSRSFTTATLRVSNKSNTENVFVTFIIVPLVVSASQTYGLDTFTICPEWNMSRSWRQQRCELQNEEGLHPSNIVNNKTSRKFTTATLRDSKRARAAPQQHCELQNEQELHHVKIVNYKTSRSCTAAPQQSTMLARAAPQQHCESKRNRVFGQIINLLEVEFNLNTFWIYFQIQQSRLCHLVIRAGLPAVDTPTSI